MSRLAEMIAGKGSVKVVPLPRAGADVAIMPLTADELQHAQLAALERCKERAVPITNAIGTTIFEHELATQLCTRFLVTVDEPHEPLAGSADELRKLLHSEEIDYLAEAYWRHQDEVSPRFEHMDEEEKTALGEASASGSTSPGSEPSGSTPSTAFQRTS